MALRVWAPSAERVDAVVGGGAAGRVPMKGPDERGWWEADVELAGGQRYGFSVDGGDVRPDPRSPWQPDGVHGLSAAVDHATFGWTDGGWRPPPLDQAMIYELHVGTFSEAGTFAGVVERLDHLVELGVTHVELMPVAAFPGRWGWGYDGVDLYAPHRGYGGPDGLKALVDACHARGLAVLLDVVYNHLGPAGNHLGSYGPYFTDRYATPWGQAVNFDDRESDEVRAFFVDNALLWLCDYHVDGLRLDAVHAILDASALHVLEELRAAASDDKVLIAESDLNDPRLVRRVEEGGYGLDAQWSDDLHHALHAVLTGERTGYYGDFGSMSQLAKALRQAFVYDGCWSGARRRSHGRAPAGVPLTRFLAYAQTHDQVGNRAQGDRLAHLVSEGRARAAAALVLCSPFVPMLFQGEEWGASTPFQYFTDHEDPELGKAVSEGRRREFAAFGWKPDDVPDPQDPATFERSRLRWDEARGPLLDWHRRLIGLRREKGLHGGLVDVRYDDDAGWLVLDRGEVVVAVNVGPEAVDVPVLGRWSDSPPPAADRPAAGRAARQGPWSGAGRPPRREAPIAIPTSVLGDGRPGEVALAWGEVEVRGAAVRLGPDGVVVLAR